MNKYPRIKDLREDKDKTQKEIAKILFMHQNQYQRYESGNREPPISMIIELSKYYNVSIDYILGISKDKGGQHNMILNEEERTFIEQWNELTKENQKALKLIIINLIKNK